MIRITGLLLVGALVSGASAQSVSASYAPTTSATADLPDAPVSAVANAPMRLPKPDLRLRPFDRRLFWSMTALHAATVAADSFTTAAGRRDIFLLNGQYVQCVETHGMGAHDPIPSAGHLALKGGIEVASVAWFDWWMLRQTRNEHSRWHYAFFGINLLASGVHGRAAVQNRACLK